MNKNKLYLGRGGIRIGNSYWSSSNYSFPFAKIKISKERVIINYDSLILKLEKKDIRFIKKYNGLFSKGIRFYHNKRNVPSFIVFWSLSVNDLFNKLNNFRYNVT